MNRTTEEMGDSRVIMKEEKPVQRPPAMTAVSSSRVGNVTGRLISGLRADQECHLLREVEGWEGQGSTTGDGLRNLRSLHSVPQEHRKGEGRREVMKRREERTRERKREEEKGGWMMRSDARSRMIS
ncbi:hypothetical protein POX_a00124 [Penicillium oxalicum]|uniref:Uncharacterized protein n=1 Tax=Penicillium oxalicum (strain 114-2 / CGMCC 5302) TaxID=933388 RepID=S8B7H6_PENO1|nr:hypothetical protein POX_a00124 [Penicillium oxalicum]EPS34908.1 hypothetical protein PDE_09872 [Penicillium oxalicum 114-2]KAI2793544.1 hypothetical protein POX_a00124 [Penicillium oxalicum]